MSCDHADCNNQCPGERNMSKKEKCTFFFVSLKGRCAYDDVLDLDPEIWI